MEIKEEELLNMLKYSFLLGFNSGIKKDDMLTEEWCVDRDADLQALLEEYKETGYFSYTDSCPEFEVREMEDL